MYFITLAVPVYLIVPFCDYFWFFSLFFLDIIKKIQWQKKKFASPLQGWNNFKTYITQNKWQLKEIYISSYPLSQLFELVDIGRPIIDHLHVCGLKPPTLPPLDSWSQPREVTLHKTGYASTYTKSTEKGSFLDNRRRRRLLHKGYTLCCESHFRSTRMSRALRCLGLKTGLENCALKIYVKLSERHDIWVLSVSKIKRMKCDTSSPLFHFKKSFKSYWVLIQRPNAI